MMWKCLGSPIPSPFDRLRTAPSPTLGEGEQIPFSHFGRGGRGEGDNEDD